MPGTRLKTPAPQREVRRVVVEVETMKILRREAAQRGTTIDRLVSDLLNVTAADGLVGAVLDV